MKRGVMSCSECGSDIDSNISNTNLPLESFTLDYRTEINENNIYCHNCVRYTKNSDILKDEKWSIYNSINLTHGQFRDKFYITPEIINYTPFEHRITARGDPQIQVTLVSEDEEVLYRESISASNNQAVYMPPFSKNSTDFSWVYNNETMVGDPEIDKDYTGGSLKAIIDFNGRSHIEWIEFPTTFTRYFEDINSKIVRNNI